MDFNNASIIVPIGENVATIQTALASGGLKL